MHGELKQYPAHLQAESANRDSQTQKHRSPGLRTSRLGFLCSLEHDQLMAQDDIASSAKPPEVFHIIENLWSMLLIEVYLRELGNLG